MSRAREFLDYLDGPLGASFTLTPDEALSYFASKGLRTTFDWREMLGAEHVTSFTVAKMMDTDLLADVQASLVDALGKGTPFKEWADGIIPTLQAKGWWGRKAVLAPDGSTVVAQLGSPSRLATIFRTNIQGAYAAGAWAQIRDQEEVAPYLMYDAVDDHRTREEHAAFDGKVHQVSSQFWQDHYPPNGWNCRCGVIQLSADDLADLGLSVSPPAPQASYTTTDPYTGKKIKLPVGIDPGFAYNAGEERLKHLAQVAIAKARKLPPTLVPSAVEGIEATNKAALASLNAEVAAAQKALAAEIGQAELKRATLKAAERSAQFQLDAALEKKTPYLAKAITDLQKTKAGQAMAPGELLAAAQLQAGKLKAQTQLSEWKKAYLADKKPPATGQAAFDALPEDAQAALLQQLDAVKAAAAAEKAAQAQLDAIAGQSAGTLEAKALAKHAGSGTPTEVLAKVQADVAAAKAAQVQAQVAAATKKAMVNGKQLTPAQAQYLGSLDDDAMAALLADVDAAKAAALPPAPVTAPAGATMQTPPGSLNPDSLVQIGPQRGSNPGGLYRDTLTGDTWYIKTPGSADHARNEVLAAKLYQAAGVDVPELRLTVLNGKPAVASRIVDDLAKTDAAGLASTAGVREGFVVDAWLANWDVVGAGLDNLLVKGGKAMRVDTGGALLFRAQGTAKGAAFGDAVTELDTFLDAAKNPNTARVFKGITAQQLEAGAARVLALSDDTIRALVAQHGPLGPLGETLAARLIARKADLAKRYGKLTEAYTKAHAQAIEVAEFAARDGLQNVDQAFLTAIKGIAGRTAKGAPLEAKDLQRVKDARAALAAWETEHLDNLQDADMTTADAHYRGWLADLDAAVAPGVGKVGAWKGGTFKGYSGPLAADPVKVKVVLPPEGLTFTQEAAKAAITKALGPSAASIDVPSRAGAKALDVVPLEHRRAITAYTGSHYRAVNEALRAGTATAAQREYARLLNEALALAPKFRGRVTRAITREGSELKQFLADHRQALTTGQAVVHKGFNSSSKGESAAFSGNIVLRIESRTGVWVQPISLVPHENEVLLRAGTRFLVKDIQERGGRYFIDLEEVGP